MLRLDVELDPLEILLKIDGDFDHRQPVEEVKQFLGLVADELLGCFIKVSVSCRDLDLHSRHSFVASGRRRAGRVGG